MRSLVLLLLVVLPGVAATNVSAYFLLPELVALEASYKNYQRVAKSLASTQRDLLIAVSSRKQAQN